MINDDFGTIWDKICLILSFFMFSIICLGLMKEMLWCLVGLVTMCYVLYIYTSIYESV